MFIAPFSIGRRAGARGGRESSEESKSCDPLFRGAGFAGSAVAWQFIHVKSVVSSECASLDRRPSGMMLAPWCVFLGESSTDYCNECNTETAIPGTAHATSSMITVVTVLIMTTTCMFMNCFLKLRVALFRGPLFMHRTHVMPFTCLRTTAPLDHKPIKHGLCSSRCSCTSGRPVAASEPWLQRSPQTKQIKSHIPIQTLRLRGLIPVIPHLRSWTQQQWLRAPGFGQGGLSSLGFSSGVFSAAQSPDSDFKRVLPLSFPGLEHVFMSASSFCGCLWCLQASSRRLQS